MSNAMRTGKRWLAGVAAGALGAGVLVGLSATPAQANTYGISVAFPSMTLISGAPVNQQIPYSTQLNGVNTSSLGNVAVTITNSSGANWISSTDDTKFTMSVGSLTSGVGTLTLGAGTTGSSPTTFGNVTTGTYTLTATLTSSSTGVALASTTMPIAVVSNANAATVTGSITFVTAGSLTASAAPTLLAATTDSVGTEYVRVSNSAGGPIVAPTSMVVGAASPTSRTGGTAYSAATAVSTPGIYTLTATTSDTWGSAGSSTIQAFFADPVDQIIGTRSVTVTSAAAVASGAITSASSAAASGISGSVTPLRASALVPATNGVSFTISGVTTVSSAGTAGVPVTITAAPANLDGTTSGSPVAYSAITPALPVTTTSGTGGAFSQTFTVSNPVGGSSPKAVAVNVAVPGSATNWYIVQFATPAVTSVVPEPGTLTAANSGTATVNAYVLDQFLDVIPNWPVRVSVTGVGATTTPASVTTDTNGMASYSIAVPAGTANGAVSSVLWSAWNGTTYSVTSTTTVNYSSTAPTVSNIAVQGTFNGAGTTFSTLTGGALNGATNPMFVNTAADLSKSAVVGSSDGFSWAIRMTATNTAGAPLAGALLTVKPSEGGYVVDASGKWATSAQIFTNSSGVATAQLSSTKTGVISYVVTSGSASSTVTARYANRPSDARTVTFESSATEVIAGSGVTLKAAVKDRFGNPVPGVPVSFTESGPGYIGGTGAGTTGAAGTIEATLVTLPRQIGESAVGAVVGLTGTASLPNAAPSAAAQTYASVTTVFQVGNAANVVTSYDFATTPAATSASVAGVAAGVASGTAVVKIVDESSKSITIVGERTTVSGKSGIKVAGIVEGIEDGKTVKPFIRFPGETTFTEGTARPAISGGEFTWQRKTGKRVTVYVTSDDGLVTSNRVTIQAS